jgi:opacity protein-like surface antigen
MRLSLLSVPVALALLLPTPDARAQGFQFGPEVAVSIPTGDAGDVAELGFDVGLTGTYMVSPVVGIGGDFGYHSWAGSDDLNEATDLLLSEYMTLLLGYPYVVTGSEWSWSAIQMTLHMKLVAPTNGPVAPWFKGGLGLYNVKAKLEALGESEAENESKLGFNAGAGIDIGTASTTTFGIAAAYHHIPTEDDFGADFTAFTVGVHVRFGTR